MKSGDFLRIVHASLESAGIPYMLTGSLASSLHGVPRATHDIDFVIAPTRGQLRTLLERFKRMGLYVSSEAATTALAKKTDFNVIDMEGGGKADLVIKKDRPFSDAEFNRRRKVDFDGLSMAIATAEDIVIAKLEWAKIGGSDRQISDVAGILRVQHELDLPYVERWVRSLALEEQWEIVRQRAASDAV